MKPRSLLNAIRNWQRLAEEARYRAASLAELCHVSLRTLRRFFNERHHVCLREWLGKLRTRRAEKFLRTEKRIKEIADALGYEQIAQFSRWFKMTHGLSPRAWRTLMARCFSGGTSAASPHFSGRDEFHESHFQKASQGLVKLVLQKKTLLKLLSAFHSRDATKSLAGNANFLPLLSFSVLIHCRETSS